MDVVKKTPNKKPEPPKLVIRTYRVAVDRDPRFKHEEIVRDDFEKEEPVEANSSEDIIKLAEKVKAYNDKQKALLKHDETLESGTYQILCRDYKKQEEEEPLKPAKSTFNEKEQ